MAYYNLVKTLKTADIGTILPWSGDGTSSKTGYENQGDLGLPKGWLVCNGASYQASEHPLLARAIGTTYGGSISGTFPDYTSLDSFLLPNLVEKHAADYTTGYLTGVAGLPASDSEAQSAIASKIGTTGSVGTNPSYSSNANLNFNLTASNTLVGKTIGQVADDPTYFKLFYTVSRKLGQRHMPNHDHGGGYPTLESSGLFAELYETPSLNYEANGKSVTGQRGNNAAENGSPDTGGVRRWTAYEGNGESHVITDKAKTFSATSLCGHSLVAGYIPTPSDKYPYTRNNNGTLRNYTGNMPVKNASDTYVVSSSVSFATTLNHNFDQWGNNPLPSGHNHGSFDLSMNKSGLKPPKTVYHYDVQTSNVAPQNVPNAVSMTVDVNTPSINMIYIIKAW